MKRLLFTLLLSTTAVEAHSWYPSQCCSVNDCEMLSAKEMKRDEESWILPNGQRVPFDKARQSLDNDFHWCRYTRAPDSQIIVGSNGPCFFAPTGGT